MRAATSINFFLFLFIIYPQSFLSLRYSYLVHPHRWFFTNHNGKDIINNKLHAMVGICKEGFHWDLIMNISFEWLDPLNSFISLWIIKHIFHCNVATTYDDINDKTEMEKFILYHIHNWISLHNFRYSLGVIWSLMLFWLLSHLILRITLLGGLWIYNYTNNTRVYTSYYEFIPTRGVIYPSRWSLRSPHIICNGDFYTVFIYFLLW